MIFHIVSILLHLLAETNVDKNANRLQSFPIKPSIINQEHQG